MYDLTRVHSELRQLPHRYVETMRGIGCTLPENHIVLAYRKLAAAYGKSDRHYHNLSHIAHCVLGYDEIKGKLRKPAVILAALFYHDAIYNPKRNDNEERSAKFFVKSTSKHLGLVSTSLFDRVSELILLTARHHVDPQQDPDGAFLIDIDMSILGAGETDYDRYVRHTREEYSMYSDNAWALGRTERFLNPTLAQERIFLTDDFEHRFGSQARENLQRERAQLAKFLQAD